MLVKVVGKYRGESKKNGNPFYMLHCINYDRKQDGLSGYAVEQIFCTEVVYENVKADSEYNLQSDFGSRTCNAIVQM